MVLLPVPEGFMEVAVAETFVETFTPASLHVSAKASSAALVWSPQYFAILLEASLDLHTDEMSAGSEYVFMAPRRQAGGVAADASEATADKARKRVVLENIFGCC